MIKSVGKYTYGTDTYTTTVRQFHSYADPTTPVVHIGAFTGIGLGCRFFHLKVSHTIQKLVQIMLLVI